MLMKRFSLCPTVVPVLLTCALAQGAQAAPAAAAVTLTPPNLASTIAQISKTADGNLCLVGAAFDPDGDLVKRGRVILYNPVSKKIVWQKTVDAPDDLAHNRFVACRSDGTYTYVGANIDTNTERSRSHSFAFVFKFDQHGKLVAKHNLVTGSVNSLIYDLDIDSAGVTVVGMDSAETETSETNAIYFAKLDSALKEAKVTRLANGAYGAPAAAKLSHDTVLLAGNFYPATVSKSANVEDYAVSKIGPSRKYQFSVRPQRAAPERIASAITPGGEIVSLGYTGKQSHLTVVNEEGKVTQDLQFNSKFCQTTALSTHRGGLYAIRKSCDQNQTAPKLVLLNRQDASEKVVGGISGEPQTLFADGSSLYLISEKPNGSLQLYTIAVGE
ncbi:MAG: hypothetical protein V4754_06635 [Pseudomonadota bacterium]